MKKIFHNTQYIIYEYKYGSNRIANNKLLLYFLVFKKIYIHKKMKMLTYYILYLKINLFFIHKLTFQSYLITF